MCESLIQYVGVFLHCYNSFGSSSSCCLLFAVWEPTLKAPMAPRQTNPNPNPNLNFPPLYHSSPHWGGHSGAYSILKNAFKTGYNVNWFHCDYFFIIK